MYPIVELVKSYVSTLIIVLHFDKQITCLGDKATISDY